MSDQPLTQRPRVRIEVLADHSAETRSDQGFIRVRRLELVNHYEDGSASRPYRYDCAERDAIDAVAIVLVARGPSGSVPRVCLRSSIRPPLALRPGYSLPIAATSADPTLFEVPAGLVEPDERGPEGLAACASRETTEETGLDAPAASFARLGPPTYLTPGLVAEQVHYLWAEVDPTPASAPTMDGSPVEESARIEWVPLPEALAACRDGRIEDVKTEVALRRLAEVLAP